MAAVEFLLERGYVWAVSENGRRWRIWAVTGGWRMEFRDPGDQKPTYAWTFGTLSAAQDEAARPLRHDPRKTAS